MVGAGGLEPPKATTAAGATIQSTCRYAIHPHITPLRGPDGARTRNQWNHDPLLNQLSYRPHDLE